ncbi:MAG TPA: DUF58 domain-containing protein [Paracoccaceae bacterium]|nr:DUF58 domain-containing protein [Paracoccaceae bacterium]
MANHAAQRAGALRRDAEKISGTLPPLLIEAERLVSTLAIGVHGRRRAGVGETFWQYRNAQPGDSLSQIDWRRSGRSDRLYIREMEWEAAETALLWCDRSRAMDFRSDRVNWSKADRARLLALATAVLLNRGAERFALLGTEAERPRTGETQLMRIAALLSRPPLSAPDYGAPPAGLMPKAGKAVFFSDFMGPREAIMPALLNAAGQGTGGIMVMILDPVEEDFPFHGRTRFESVARQVRHDTDEATALRRKYLDRLARRRDELTAVARRANWHLVTHRTDESPRRPLVRLHGILGGA